ncbi:hypothetical protein QFC21_001892 [Naganishia friedmannii]|uniref:Uncharacterized protein n=1 Tax=Naganishia friedmannii TaxID=89922 RepID=A0ACC2W3S9_9TREE|nr:hypothetical protein QFC21_001892 [Naganishia friedmannii]
MYPSGFYQPFCHSGQSSRRNRSAQPTYVLSAEPVCRTNPSIFDLQHLVSQHSRQHRTAQLAAQQEREQAHAYQRQREREYQRHLALNQERQQAIEQERHRRVLARREYERQLAVEEEKQAAIRAYHYDQRRSRFLAQQRVEEEQRREYEAAVNARQAPAQRQEELTLAASINSLFQNEPKAVEKEGPSAPVTEYHQEDVAAEPFDDSSDGEEDSEDQGLDMSTLLNSLFRSMGVSTDATAEKQTPVDRSTVSEKQSQPATPAAEEPVPAFSTESADAAAVAAEQDAAPTFADIQERYEQHQHRVQRLEVLEALNTKLESLASSFTFPSTLDFQSQASTSSDTSTIPQLEYTPNNTPYHAHAHSLLALLVEADAVTSEGDEEVRARRKEFVVLVEKELDGLEREKARVWRAKVNGGR